MYAAGFGFLTAGVDYYGVGPPETPDTSDHRQRDISEGENSECVPFGLFSWYYGKSSRVHDRHLGL